MSVLLIGDIGVSAARELATRYGVTVQRVASGGAIPGSYWGAPEAGIVGDSLFVRDDTPVHSFLHECCHFVCMTPERRESVHTDAEGDDLEECAVCFLQLLLADELAGLDRDRLFQDMDAWGYSFRLGSSRAWFENDSLDAALWLSERGLIDTDGRPTFQINTLPAAAEAHRDSGV